MSATITNSLGCKSNQKESETLLQSIVESMVEGLCLVDRDGVIQYVNKRMATLVDKSVEDLQGMKLSLALFSGKDDTSCENASKMEQRIKDRLEGISEQYELEIHNKNQQPKWLKVNAAPLRDASNNIIGSISAYTDITEQKRLENQLEWSEKMEAVGRLAGCVSHDFNNLLTAILGYSDMALNSINEDDPNFRRLTNIKNAGEIASALTQQLLTFSRKDIIEPNETDVNQLIVELERAVRGILKTDIELVTFLQPDLPLIQADFRKFQQIILNLITNSKEAMPNGGSVVIETSEIEINKENTDSFENIKEGHYVSLSIRDTGIGIDNETKSMIFEPFFSTKKDSSGLGLSTVYGIVQQHKGHIKVDSKPGRGTSFTFYFPTSQGSKNKYTDSKGKVVPISKEIYSLEANAKTILVVDDETVVRSMVSDALQDAGYRVLEAETAAKAQKLSMHYSNKIDLILTDVVMPGVDGYELCKVLRKSRPNTRQMIMSGYANDTEVIDKVAKEGIPFIEKPFTPMKLLQKVDNILHTPQRERSIPALHSVR